MAQEQNNRQAILKTSFFGGFDKKEVLAYIDRLREENSAHEAALDTQLHEVTAARNKLGEQVDGFEKKLQEMEKQLSERSDKIRDMNGQIDKLEGELTATRKKQDDTDRALRLQQEQNKYLVQRMERSEEQAKKYNEVTSQLGDMMLTAQRDAQRIVADANEQAQQLHRETLSAGTQLSEEFTTMKSDLTRLREQLAELVESFSNRITEAEELIDSLQRRTEEQAAQTAETLQTAETSESQPADKANDTRSYSTARSTAAKVQRRARSSGDIIERLLSRK